MKLDNNKRINLHLFLIFINVYNFLYNNYHILSQKMYNIKTAVENRDRIFNTDCIT
jgi:hypothetical protein